MKLKPLWWILGGIGILFILSSLAISIVEYQRYKNTPVLFPAGSQVAGVPIGGLDKDGATARVAEYYDLPISIEIEDGLIQVDPLTLGFELDAEGLVEEAASQLQRPNYWSNLFRPSMPEPVDIALKAQVSSEKISDFLEREILPRYTNGPTMVSPILGTTNFSQGNTGEQLDLDRAVADITEALLSPTIHTVTLETSPVTNVDPDLAILEPFLKHNIDWVGFDELVEIYLQSMETGEVLHFAFQGGNPVEPDVAFTAASTIKIPIMISVLRRTSEPTPEAVVDLLERMIAFSENPPADTLMSAYLDEVRGPLLVSEDLAALGMENSFLAGYFYLGAPVLQIFETPANSREDIFLDPDIYNQTVASEAGQLLSGIYACANGRSNLLTETFPEEITQSECQLMIDILAENKIGLLIEGGLGPDATAAHKHGWVRELDGLLHSMSDTGIIFTPGGDYVLCIFVYDPVRLDFDQGNLLFTRLSQTVYNFFNIDDQVYWWFE